MFMFDAKKAAQGIMAGRKKDGMDYGPSPMKNEKVMDEDGAMDGRHMASQDMINAFHEKSPDKLKSAMIDFMDLHMAAKNNEEEAEGAGSRESMASDDLSD